MKLTLGIPDDTPENVAHNIRCILEEEAKGVGAAEFTCKARLAGLGDAYDVYVEANDRTFYIYLNWIKLSRLRACRRNNWQRYYVARLGIGASARTCARGQAGVGVESS